MELKDKKDTFGGLIKKGEKFTLYIRIIKKEKEGI